jgi:hypothetical protein
MKIGGGRWYGIPLEIEPKRSRLGDWDMKSKNYGTVVSGEKMSL